MVLPGIAQAAPALGGVEVERLSGTDRVKTAIAVSQKAYKDGEADTVVLAGYLGAADALTGTLLANAKKAPLLIAGNKAATAEVVAEIARLGAKKVYILGGEKAVLPAIETELKAITGLTVERLGGANRTETAIKIAKAALGTTNPTQAFVVQKNALVDALSIGPVAAEKNAPILFVEKDSVPADTKAALADMGITNVTIVGGETRVSLKGEAALKALVTTVDRVDGLTRSATALKIAKKYNAAPKALFVANEMDSPDALVAGYLAALRGGSILLTGANKISDDTKAYLAEKAVDTYVLGGTAVVTPELFTEVKAAVEGEVVAELKVVSVSAITKTAVDVKLEALKEAKAGATIEVRDNKGNLVEVKPVDLVKGETVASFTFERALTVDPEGVWTVGGVKVDLDLQKNLKSVYNYTNQIKLLEGLNKLGLSNVNADNIVQYQNAIDKLKNIADKDNYVSEENFTKAVAQKVVNDGNKAAAEVKDEKAIVKAVNEATNQVALLNALSTFERVNPEWIAAYDAAIGTTETSIKGIQTKIDNTNKSNVDTKVTALNLDATTASVVKKDLDEAKALVSAYQKPDGKGETAKAETLRKIDRQLAVRKVLDATTPAQLTVAINGLKAVDAAFEFSMDNFKDANRQAYLDAIKLNPGNFNTISKINAQFSTVNDTQAATPIANVKAKGNFAVAAPTATQKAELLAALKAADLKHVSDSNIDAYATLADASATSKNAFGEITISGTLANDKATVQALVEKANLAAIQAATTADDVYTALVAYGNDVKDLSVNNKAQYLTDKANYKTDKATVQKAVDASNIKELQAQNTGTAAGVLAKLNIMTQVKNVKAENAAAYLASVKKSTTVGTDLGHTDIDTIAEVQTVIDAVNTAEAATVGVKAVNEATTATQMRDILTDLVVDGDITAASYLNLTNADKLLVAELFLNDDVFTSTGLAGAVRTSVDANGDYTALGNIGTDVAKLATAFDKLRTDTNTVFSGKNVGTVTIGSVQAELDKLVKANYTAYDKLTGTQKLAVAEKFIASFPVDKDGAKYLSGYTTMGAYTAAVDAAIAAAK